MSIDDIINKYENDNNLNPQPPTAEETEQYLKMGKYLKIMSPEEKQEALKFHKYYNEKREKYQSARTAGCFKKVGLYALLYTVTFILIQLIPFLGVWMLIIVTFFMVGSLFSSSSGGGEIWHDYSKD